MEKCFVIQPFDGAEFDDLYREVLVPAINEAGLDPYRVDKDPHTDVLIDAIEEGIAESRVCLAEITTNNPNVWYELGYASALRKPVVMITQEKRVGNFPFDVRHRSIIEYKTTKGGFSELSHRIVEKLRAAQIAQRREAEVLPREWHSVNHGYRDYMAYLVSRGKGGAGFVAFIDGQRRHIENVCRSIANIISASCGSDCRVSVKLMKSNNKCETFCRSERIKDESVDVGNEFSIDGDVNSAFADALTQKSVDGIYRFYGGDLKALSDVGQYFNSRPEWASRYNCAIVVPIQFVPHAGLSEPIQRIGYLCVDTQRSFALNDAEHVQILAAFADQMFNFFGLGNAIAFKLASEPQAQ
jgi:hypothetical protein